MTRFRLSRTRHRQRNAAHKTALLRLQHTRDVSKYRVHPFLNPSNGSPAAQRSLASRPAVAFTQDIQNRSDTMALPAGKLDKRMRVLWLGSPTVRSAGPLPQHWITMRPRSLCNTHEAAGSPNFSCGASRSGCCGYERTQAPCR